MSLLPDQPLFYSPQIPAPGMTLELNAEESRHASSAKRMRVDNEIFVFDGMGRLAQSRVMAVGRRQPVRVEILACESNPRPAPVLHLAAALPKGDRQSMMLDMATQLGMQCFTPLLAEHSVVKPPDKSAERLQRICLAACKQSRRLWLPEILPPSSLRQAVEEAGKRGALIIVAHPGKHRLMNVAREKYPEILVLVGPEGGFSSHEIRYLEQVNGQFVDLGKGILRIETAAVALLARLQSDSEPMPI